MDTVQQTTDTLETTRLIAADKVEGTPVESTNGDSLGHVHDIMIDKISGQVGYAVLKYGSFLGLGGKLFALPWDLLKYDTKRNAYVIGIPVEKLKGAPDVYKRQVAAMAPIRSICCRRSCRNSAA